MRGFTNAMGMGQMWNEGGDTSKSSVSMSKDEEAKVGLLQITSNSNLATCYAKMEDWEKSLRYAECAQVLDESHTKSKFLVAQALVNLGRNKEVSVAMPIFPVCSVVLCAAVFVSCLETSSKQIFFRLTESSRHALWYCKGGYKKQSRKRIIRESEEAVKGGAVCRR